MSSFKKTAENIKIDLHIHSDFSGYKDEESITKNSNKENLDTLFNKLEENKISIFSITDHNKFNLELYQEIYKKLENESYKFIKTIIPGVEFNVNFEELDEKTKGSQLNLYFEVKNDQDLIKISEVINKKNSVNNDKNKKYSKEELIKIIRSIDLNTILIASQTKSIRRHDGKDNALSDSTTEEKIIEYIANGFISALEVQNSKVEGALIDDFVNRNKIDNPALIKFSDCHEWEYYPKHDKNSKNQVDSFTVIKSQPTFKGLLYALNLKETRMNRNELNSSNYIEKISFEKNEKVQEIWFDKSINVIIGNNGAGKTFLANVLSNQKKLPKYYLDINKKFKFNVDSNVPEPSKEIIKQNEIVDNIRDGKVMFIGNIDDFFKDDDSEFRKNIERYFVYLKDVVFLNIEKNNYYSNYKNKKLIFNIDSLETFTPSFSSDDLDIISSKFNERLESIKKIISRLGNLITELDFLITSDKDEKDNYTKFKNFIEKRLDFYKLIEKNINLYSLGVANKIVSIFAEKNIVYKRESNALDKSRSDYRLKKSDFMTEFKKFCISASKIITKDKIFSYPKELVIGYQEKNQNGFTFKYEKKYYKTSVDIFFQELFVKKFRTESKLKEINSLDDWKKSLLGCGDEYSNDELDSFYVSKINKFVEKYRGIKSETIEDISNKKELGRTVGEISMASLKYKFLNSTKDSQIVILDQPEDNISNKNIISNLIPLVNSIRDKNQIFIVTHNPLLIINLDPDNIIFVDKKNVKKNEYDLEIYNGSLDYEGSDWKVMSSIIRNVEGGRENLKKRMEIYKYENDN